jgi:putative DNA methylase
MGYCKQHKYFLKKFDECDLKVFSSLPDRESITFQKQTSFKIEEGPKSKDLLRRGIRNYQDLFSNRQLLFLKHASELIKNVSDANRLWLSLLVSTSLEFNSLLCGYKGSSIRRPGAIRHVFSHHAYSFPYTSLENNPIFPLKTSGTLMRLFCDPIEKSALWAMNPVERKISDHNSVDLVKVDGEVDGGRIENDFQKLLTGSRKFLVLQHDSKVIPLPDESVDHIVTDPPYFDSVQYSDLSKFFRVWLQEFLPDEANWDFMATDSAVSNNLQKDQSFYRDTLAKIWLECRRVLKTISGKLIFTFHHWNPVAWADLSVSLIKAGFVLEDKHIVLSENPISVHINNLKSLKHDAILILRPKEMCATNQKWKLGSLFKEDDSYMFCSDCATLLGWVLDNCDDSSDVTGLWQNKMKG